ncbi:general stress protein [Microbacterium terricola]|uniref:General stress protein 17M-like domain-containing protein n=1 Tax=Microbacterium terricola TaxID=344163 RepID=A0ABM8DZS0_9MICO|nr:general stress protein [Microbacterium terricola]UYK41224.1 hypothetical protein OAU46_06195 [Microbacterium terricola]BDV31000.1 hypothetical protein Microterr_16600 [Microbacterium terricola]
MSMIGGRFPQAGDDVGKTIAAFSTYEEAQKLVSELIESEVPAREIAIVGVNLRSIERVTGRLGYATAARSGAINGLLLGLLFAAIFVLGSPSPPIQVFAGVVLIGIALGMLISIIGYAFLRRRRDYASVMQVRADRYEVTARGQAYHLALTALGPRAGHLGAGAAAQPEPTQPVAPVVPATPAAPGAAPVPRPAAADPAEPPRYGERRAPATEPVPQPAAPPQQPAEPAQQPAGPAQQPAEPDDDDSGR